ncbi:MAG TPA: hypothetical protein VKA40_05945 [Nitrososphaera sp.]|nr:hypothetical protein [Nitrososphaera sp.]
MGQTLQTATAPITFESVERGFRVQVPAGWAVDEGELIPEESLRILEEAVGFSFQALATFCPQDQALPAIGGTMDCGSLMSTTTEPRGFVTLLRYDNLYERPEFASLRSQNKNITASDLSAYTIQNLQSSRQMVDVKLMNSTDRTINVIDAQTNQTVTTVPAKLVEFTYTQRPSSFEDPSLRGVYMFFLDPSGNTGYVGIEI